MNKMSELMEGEEESEGGWMDNTFVILCNID